MFDYLHGGSGGLIFGFLSMTLSCESYKDFILVLIFLMRLINKFKYLYGLILILFTFIYLFFQSKTKIKLPAY